MPAPPLTLDSADVDFVPAGIPRPRVPATPVTLDSADVDFVPAAKQASAPIDNGIPQSGVTGPVGAQAPPPPPPPPVAPIDAQTIAGAPPVAPPPLPPDLRPDGQRLPEGSPWERIKKAAGGINTANIPRPFNWTPVTGAQSGDPFVARNYHAPTAADAHKPVVDLPALGLEDLVPGHGAPSQVARGIVGAGESFVSGLTSPTNLAIIAGTMGVGASAPIVTRLVSLGFSYQMFRDAVEQVPGFTQQVKDGDVEGATKTLSMVAAGLYLGRKSAEHGLAPEGLGAVKPHEIAPGATRELIPDPAEVQAQEGHEAVFGSPAPGIDRGPAGKPTPRALAPQWESQPEIPGPPAPPPSPFADLSDTALRQMARVEAQGPKRAALEAEMQLRFGQPPNRAQRRATTEIPETGTAAGVAEGVDKRNRIAQQYGARSYEDLSIPDKLAVDNEIAEGNTGAASGPPPSEPVMPVAGPSRVEIPHLAVADVDFVPPRQPEVPPVPAAEPPPPVTPAPQVEPPAPPEVPPVQAAADAPLPPEAKDLSSGDRYDYDEQTYDQSVADHRAHYDRVRAGLAQEHPDWHATYISKLADEQTVKEIGRFPAPRDFKTKSPAPPEAAPVQAAEGAPKPPLEAVSPPAQIGSNGALQDAVAQPAQPQVAGDANRLAAEASAAPAATNEGTYLGAGLGALQPYVDKFVQQFKGTPPATRAEKYAKQDVAAREAARNGPNSGWNAKIKAVIAKAKAEGVNSFSPVFDAIAKAQKQFGFQLMESGQIRNNVDRVHRAASMAKQFIEDNHLDTMIRRVADVDYLDRYMVAKHAQTVEMLDPNRSMTGRDWQEDDNLIREFRNKIAIEAKGNQPAMTYDEVAQKFTAASNKLLDMSATGGLISWDLAKALRQMYPDYVPLDRIFNEIETGGITHNSGQAVASLSKQTIVRKLAGSERSIENPLYSTLKRTYDAFRQVEVNKAGEQLAGYRNLPGMSHLFTELKPGEAGPAETTISYLDHGVKRSFKTTPEFAAAAKSLDHQAIGLLGQVFSVPNRIFKTGTTGMNPAFILSNIAKDMGHTFVTSRFDKSLANPAMFGKALFAVAKHNDFWKEIVRQGAGFTSFDQIRNEPVRTIASIRATRNLGTAARHAVFHPIDSIGGLWRVAEDIVGRSEEIGRARLYAMAKDAALKAGRTEMDARSIAARESNNALPNYLDIGSKMRPLNATIPYLNAGIQGSVTFVRAMKTNPVRTTASLVTSLYFPVAAATLWNLSDPERKKVYEDIQSFEKDNNLLLVMPNWLKKDTQNRYTVIKIGLPQGIGQLTIPLRRMIEAAHGLDPVRFGEVANAVIGSVSPVEPNIRSATSTLAPQLIKPTLQAVANYDFFKDKPKVPGQLAALPTEMQTRSYTSGTARLIANHFPGGGAAPIKTEEWLKDTFGGITPQVLNAVDHVLAKAGVIPKNEIGGVSTPAAIGARFSKAGGGELTDKEFTMRTAIQVDNARRAVIEARTMPDYLDAAGNKDLQALYLMKVAQRAKSEVEKTTMSPQYLEMEPDEKIAALKQLKAELEHDGVAPNLLRPIKEPIVPPSQQKRWAMPPPRPPGFSDDADLDSN